MPYAIAVFLWFLASIALSWDGRLQSLTPPEPQLIVATLAIATVVAVTRLPGLRSRVDALDLRWLVGIHLVRLGAGLVFVRLALEGGISRAFGLPAGYGDTAVALLAALLLVGGPVEGAGRRRALLLWNWAGLIDLLLVVVSAARLGMRDPAGMAALLRLPLSLLPTFLVPILLASHIVIFWRSFQMSREP